MSPKVSVILPAYNAERFLQEAIDSMLQQTYTDFELLIIDDGSRDSTREIVESYKDPRVVYLYNTENSGLAYSLNKGIDHARGDYIARMDADDISLPERLTKQVAYLNRYSYVSMIDCYMEYMDENGKRLNRINSKVVLPESIKYTLPRKNCLGHSSVMIRANVLKKFRYNNVGNEDYDLWLRMISAGKIIYKIPEILLLYRVHDESYTQSATLKGKNVLRTARTKRAYLANQLFKRGKFTWFNFRVCIFMVIDYITGWWKLVKRSLRK